MVSECVDVGVSVGVVVLEEVGVFVFDGVSDCVAVSVGVIVIEEVVV